MYNWASSFKFKLMLQELWFGSVRWYQAWLASSFLQFTFQVSSQSWEISTETPCIKPGIWRAVLSVKGGPLSMDSDKRPGLPGPGFKKVSLRNQNLAHVPHVDLYSNWHCPYGVGMSQLRNDCQKCAQAIDATGLETCTQTVLQCRHVSTIKDQINTKQMNIHQELEITKKSEKKYI